MDGDVEAGGKPPSPLFVSKMIRNMLANEYGVNPKVLRAEIHATIRDIVTKEVRKLLEESGFIRKLLSEVVVSTLYGTSNGYATSTSTVIANALRKAMEEEAQRVVRAAVQITITPKDQLP